MKMKFKNYWVSIPSDAPNRATAATDYVGPCGVCSSTVSVDKVILKMPISHFFFGNGDIAKYIIVTRASVIISYL
jgi:hypothetical protein